MEAISILLATTLALVIYYLYKKIRHPFDTIKSWGLYPLPCYPILGNFAWDQGPFDRDTFQKYKHQKIVGLQGFRTPMMFILDRKILKRIMVKEFHAFSDRLLLAMAPAPMNKSVFSISNDHWRHVRGFVSPTFTTGKLKAMWGLLDGAAQNALDFLENRKNPEDAIEGKAFFTRFTIDAVASTMFGLDMNSHEDMNHPFVQNALHAFNASLTNPWLVLSLLIPELMHVFSKFGSAITNTGRIQFFLDIVQRILKDRKEHPEEIRHDFMHTLASSEIYEKDCDKTAIHPLGYVGRWSAKGLTTDEILSQGVAFMAAGFETTASTLRMVAYCLAVYPNFQQKVHDEISEILHDDEVTYDDLTKFAYLDMVISETLRVYPPANRIERRCCQTIDLDGFLIPEGTLILIPLYVFGMDPDYFPNPDIFDPERFSASEKAARGQFDYMPFGAGPRSCIGMRLAWQEMRLMIVKLLHKYRIELSGDSKMPDELDYDYTGFLRVHSPIKFKFIPR